MQEKNNLLYLGRTSWREPRLFGIPNEDRRAHLYMVGKTGTGKSTVMEFMLRQDAALFRRQRPAAAKRCVQQRHSSAIANNGGDQDSCVENVPEFVLSHCGVEKEQPCA